MSWGDGSSGQGGLDPELQKAADKFGLTAEDLAALGGGGGADPNDPPVFFGSMGSYTADDDVLRAKGGRKKYGGDITKSLSEANLEFYRLDTKALVDLQTRMIQAGILPPDHVVGDYDDDTYKRFAAINERAARFKAAGRNVTPNDVLGMIESASPGMEEGQGEPGAVTRVSDALTLEEQMQDAARRNLGRKLKASEISKFVALYQGMEGAQNARSVAMQRQAAESGQDASITDIPSAGVAAEQYIQSNYAQEAAGQSSYGYLEALRGLVGGS